MSAEDKPMFPFNDTSVMRHPAKAIQRESTKNEVMLPILASTVAGSQMALAQHRFCMVLCDECLADGDYRAIVEIAKLANTRPPVIVLSRTGDWPEYLAATRAG